ncbi:MAG TPA: ABC transporter permease [Candidatus Saccharibacteria bacterium]|nr:ABC transporter permease [Candidatus Saccharibacteria bacterium]
MHNFSTVFTFEFMRTIKKKSFWVSVLSFPVLMAAIFGIVYFSNIATQEAAEKTQEQKFSIQLTDKSGLLTTEVIQAVSATTVEDRQAGIDAVRSGSVDAYFYYPADLKKDRIEVYGKEVGIFNNSRYSGVANSLLNQSVGMKVDPNIYVTLTGAVQTASTTFQDGQEYDGIRQMIAPGLFLVLFYLVIAMFGSQMLTSTTEEKENRVIEMLLTSVDARTLIVGKIVAVIALGLLQVLLIAIPAIVGYAALHDSLSLPSLDVSSLAFNTWRISSSFVIFILSFLFFTGLLVAIGAAVPTAKEANGFIGAVMMLLFAPLYAVTLFVSSPESAIVQFLSYFPLTSPIPLLLRNAVGNLSVTEALIACGLLLIATIFIIRLAVRLFRFGALEYSRKLSLKEIIGRS